MITELQEPRQNRCQLLNSFYYPLMLFPISVSTRDKLTATFSDYRTAGADHFDFLPFMYIFGGIAAAGIILWLIGHRRKKK